MRKLDEDTRDMIYIALGFFGAVALALLAAWVLNVWQDPKQNQAIDDMVAEQMAEGQHYTAIVESVDMTTGVVTLDNGDELAISDLQGTPSVGDILAYTKSFEYIISKWNGYPKKTENAAYLNVKSIGHTTERTGGS